MRSKKEIKPVINGLPPVTKEEKRPQNEAAQYRQDIMIDTDQYIRNQENFNTLQQNAQDNLAKWKKESKKQTHLHSSKVQVIEGDTLDIAGRLAQEWGEIPTVLNMANAYCAGGGYREGMPAQEENVFRRSTAAAQVKAKELNSDNHKHYNKGTTHKINAQKNEVGQREVVLDSEPRVCFKTREIIQKDSKINTDKSYNKMPDEDIFPFYELKAAAIDRRGQHVDVNTPLSEREKDEMKARIQAQLDTLQQKGHRIVVLSAFGCGAFLNPAKEVANLYKEVLQDKKYIDAFDAFTFAIYFPGYGVNNFPTFQSQLNGLDIGQNNEGILEQKTLQENKEFVKDIGILVGGIVGSTIIGAVLGTFVFPGLGTIAGSAFGAVSGATIGLAATGFQGLIRNRLVGGLNTVGESVAAGFLTTLGATGTGALIGTIFLPGIGTAIGAGIGLVVGALTSAIPAFTRWVLSPGASEKNTTDLKVEDFEDLGRESNLYSNDTLISKAKNRPRTVSDSDEEKTILGKNNTNGVPATDENSLGHQKKENSDPEQTFKP